MLSSLVYRNLPKVFRLSSSVVDTIEILKSKFGLDKLRPKQESVIENVLAGKHTLAILPTGYGKSLCYQLPSQIIDGLTLVISPLISLMQDQIVSLQKRGIESATFINSSLSERELYERGQAIRNGQIKLLYVAPERFESEHFRALLSSIKVSLLVIDEAHCISHWGHDFRPQYKRMSQHFSQFKESTFLALTATATNNVKQEIVDLLGVESCEVVEGNLDRKNLVYNVASAPKVIDKDSILLERVKRYSGSSIIYVNSRKECERISRFLRSEKVKANYYHAGMFSDARNRVQSDFEEDKIDTIVCTTAFGMGIDKPDVRQVIHFTIPNSIESYYQESGRAGRDGQSSTCTLIFQKRDLAIQKWLIGKRYPDASQLLEIYNLIHESPGSSVHWSQLNEMTDIEQSLVNRSVEHLRYIGLVDLVGSNFTALGFEEVNEENICTDDLAERRSLDEQRLNRVGDFALSSMCRRQRLIEYFDQEFAGLCSGCDICNRMF